MENPLLDIIQGVDLSGPASDLRAIIITSLALALILCGAFLIARVLGVRMGGYDDD